MSNAALTQTEMAAIDTKIADLYRTWSTLQARVDKDQDYIDNPHKLGAHMTQQIIDRIDAMIAEAQAAWAHYIEAETIDYQDWTRFYLVNNTGGHIHRSMGCSTCNKNAKRTSFSWLPELSGLTEADAVAAHGAILCTTCFPSAPVEYTNGHELAAQAKAAAKCQADPRDFRNATDPRRVRQSATCNGCGHYGALTSTRKMRAHKPANA